MISSEVKKVSVIRAIGYYIFGWGIAALTAAFIEPDCSSSIGRAIICSILIAVGAGLCGSGE